MTDEIDNAVDRSIRNDIDRVMQERYPGKTYEILDYTEVAWVGWEADTLAALVQRPGEKVDWVLLEQVDLGTGTDDVAKTLRHRITVYERLIVDTLRVLAKYESMGGKQ